MADYHDIRYSTHDGVATITLHRPDSLNAFTYRMAAELVDALDRIDADDAVRGVVVTGEGRAFCAGADLSGGQGTFDLSEAADPDSDAAQQYSLLRDVGGAPADLGGVVVLRMNACTKALVAAINGAAVGVGLTMTLPMDVRLAVEGAKMALPFTRRGISIDGAASWFLPRVVSAGTASEWVLSGRTFRSEEALERGLVQRLYPDADSVRSAATDLVHEIAENTSPVSVAVSRRLLRDAMGEGSAFDAHRRESIALFRRGRSADVREGVTAFLEKRPAVFVDRVSTSDEVLDPPR